VTGTDPQPDEVYLAVGRYVVEFSRLIFHMRIGIERRLAGEGSDPLIAAMAMGAAMADPIAEAFFATCAHVADLNEEEQRIGVRLRKEVRDEIRRRNDFAHGDWSVGTSAFREEPTLSRVKPGRKDGARHQRELPPADIEEIADALFALRQKVAEYGSACLGTYPVNLKNGEAVRVRNVLKMDGHEVARTGLVRIEWV
jgi:hypothetical protein